MDTRTPYYIVEGYGDLADKDYNGGYKNQLCPPRVFPSLKSALLWLEAWEHEDEGGKLDPEDDRVLIWEAVPMGARKVVWHFSGWHWDAEEFGLEQGKFLGHEKSVYSECGF